MAVGRGRGRSNYLVSTGRVRRTGGSGRICSPKAFYMRWLLMLAVGAILCYGMYYVIF